MTELNKEIINEINKLDCSNNMKLFLLESLEYELVLHESTSQDSKQAIGKEYKKMISKFSKEG